MAAAATIELSESKDVGATPGPHAVIDASTYKNSLPSLSPLRADMFGRQIGKEVDGHRRRRPDIGGKRRNDSHADGRWFSPPYLPSLCLYRLARVPAWR